MKLEELAQLNSEAYVLKAQVDRIAGELNALKRSQESDKKEVERLGQVQGNMEVRATKIAETEKSLTDKQAELKTRLDILKKEGVELPVLNTPPAPVVRM